MLVHSLKYKNVQINYPPNTSSFYIFKDGFCDMPIDLALKITSMSVDYELDKSKLPDNKFFKFDPNSWKQKKLIWDCSFGYANGYGKLGMSMVEALADLVDLRIICNNVKDSEEFISNKVKGVLTKEIDVLDSFHVQLYPVHMFNKRTSERQLGYSMHETTRIPKLWVDRLNNDCERVLVPSEYQKEAFINSGVSKDVFVLPAGLDLRFLPELPRRKEDGIWRFGIMGGLTSRKGTDILIKAFKKAFPKNDDVELMIKTQKGIGANWLQDALSDPRIEVNNQTFTPNELATKFFNNIDCFVFPTHGEGFGLPPLEAMAMSLPVICTNYSGCADYLDKKYSIPISYKEVQAPLSEFMGYPDELRAEGQMWADPDFDEIVEAMRWTYNNKDEARKLGQKARNYVRRFWTNTVTAKKLIKYLDSKF